MSTYIHGFQAYKTRLQQMVPKLDLRHLYLENSDDEVGAFSSDKDKSISPEPIPVEAPTPSIEDTTEIASPVPEG